jgi:nucleobase transporter 1/2
VLLGILLSWFVAWVTTISGAYNSAPPEVQAACRTDQSNVLANSPWFRFPYPGQWGPVHISWASTLTMLAGEGCFSREAFSNTVWHIILQFLCVWLDNGARELRLDLAVECTA